MKKNICIDCRLEKIDCQPIIRSLFSKDNPYYNVFNNTEFNKLYACMVCKDCITKKNE